MPSVLRPRYDRIVSLILVILIGVAVIFLIDINPSNFRARLGGDLPAITLSWVLIASLVLVASSGADLLIRGHPEMQTRALPILNLGFVQIELAPAFWILPSFAIIAPFALFRIFSGSLGMFAAISAVVSSGALVFAALLSQHYALDRRPEVHRKARLGIQVIVLILAYAVFSAIAYARLRWLYSSVLIGTSAGLLAYGLLHWAPARGSLVLLAIVVGITLAEATWALNYWAAPFLLGGVLLLSIFHVITGVLQSFLEGGLNRQLILEYCLIGGGMLVAVAVASLR